MRLWAQHLSMLEQGVTVDVAPQLAPEVNTSAPGEDEPGEDTRKVSLLIWIHHPISKVEQVS